MVTKAAVVFEKSGKFSVESLQTKEPEGDEVLVRSVAAGICHTDIGWGLIRNGHGMTRTKSSLIYVSNIQY